MELGTVVVSSKKQSISALLLKGKGEVICVKSIEVRGFLELSKLFKEWDWPMPLVLKLDKTVKAGEVTKRLEIPTEAVDMAFVNGFLHGLEYPVQPGDRMAFVPPGPWH